MYTAQTISSLRICLDADITAPYTNQATELERGRRFPKNQAAEAYLHNVFKGSLPPTTSLTQGDLHP